MEIFTQKVRQEVKAIDDSEKTRGIDSTVPIVDVVEQGVRTKNGFVEKYFEQLRWSVGVYHISFALWATFTLFQALIPAINNLIFSLPLIFFIVVSIIGSIRLLKNKPHAYNYLIAAQIPQVIIMQLNGFIYLLLIGQWIILRVGGGQLLGIDFGILDARYSFIFGSANQIPFLFGINIIPLVLIFILLKMEEVEVNIKTAVKKDDNDK